MEGRELQSRVIAKPCKVGLILVPLKDKWRGTWGAQ